MPPPSAMCRTRHEMLIVTHRLSLSALAIYYQSRGAADEKSVDPSPGEIPAGDVLKLDSALKRNHARRTVAAQSDAEQSRGWRDRAFQGSEFGGYVPARDSSLDAVGQREVGVIEGVEELHVEAQRSPFPERKLARKVDVRVCEMRPAQRVAPGVCRIGSWPPNRPRCMPLLLGSTTETKASGFSHWRVPLGDARKRVLR